MAPEQGKKEHTPPPSYTEAEPSNKETMKSTPNGNPAIAYELNALSSDYENIIPEPSKNLYLKTYDNYYEFEEDSTLEANEDNPVYKIQNVAIDVCTKHSKFFIRTTLALLFIAYTIYFGFAVNYSVQKSMALIVITCIVVALIIYVFIRDHFGNAIYEHFFKHIEHLFDKNWRWIKWLFYPALGISVVLYLSLDVVKDIKQLQSLSGFVLFILLTYITSKYPDKIQWRPVLWGYVLQFILAILVLRWEYGYIAVKFLADEITKFLEYAYEGAAAIFGDPWMLFHAFVFFSMPLLIYIGAVMSILYYCGITQIVAVKIAWLMQFTMHTTAIETLSVASNIFLNGMDSMLMLRHYLPRLTRSEFNALLVGNHATVAGFAFAIFVAFGAPPQHLLSAAVMSAPATMAIAKLNFPETEKSITEKMEDVKLDRGNDTNVFEAAANGSAVAGKTVMAVIVNFISFLGMLAFVNATLSWLGGRVGFPQLTFELMCSYLMWPLALIMGVDINECQEVAKLIGIKVFTSEILAYQELGKSMSAGLLNERSRAIATYALCGFSSLSTLAIAVGVWNSICPQKVGQMASSMFRVIVEANVSCFMTACIAGLFYTEDMAIFQQSPEESPLAGLINWILGIIPGYKELMSAIDY